MATRLGPRVISGDMKGEEAARCRLLLSVWESTPVKRTSTDFLVGLQPNRRPLPVCPLWLTSNGALGTLIMSATRFFGESE